MTKCRHQWSRVGNARKDLGGFKYETVEVRICGKCLRAEFRTRGAWSEITPAVAFDISVNYHNAYAPAHPFRLLMRRSATGPISEWPPEVTVVRDRANALHNEVGPALVWEGHLKVYYWHNVEVPSHWIMKPETITRSEFMSESNTERRRILYEILGEDAVLRLLGAKLIDEAVKGGYPRLYEMDDPVYHTQRMVEVKDPSSGKVYSHFVRRDINNALEAVASMWNMTTETYHPAKEA